MVKRFILALYDDVMFRLNCCGPIVGCGCAIVIVLPVTGLIGAGTWAVLS
jgi:hypothetical protein